jgi:TM2 domain-containing membrane protein YozV
MQALDLFRFSKYLRTSGQFTLEQSDALTEALASALINLEDHKIDNQAPAVVPEHNKTTAALLAIFLGDFGVHKFYLGQSLFGFLYLIFFWTFIPALIGFIEGLNYLSDSRDEFAERYG